MVKIRIKFGSFGSFGSTWVGDNVPGRILGSLHFGFFRSIHSNLKVLKMWGLKAEMGLYLRKYKYFVKEVYQRYVVSCMGVWVVAFEFLIFENFKMLFWWWSPWGYFWVESNVDWKLIFDGKFKIGYWAILLIYLWKLMQNNVKNSILSISFHLGVCKMSYQVVDIE